MKKLLMLAVVVVAAIGIYFGWTRTVFGDCARLVDGGFRPVSDVRAERFVGKVRPNTARCRGGDNALVGADTPWLDWSNYWGTSDASSKSDAFSFLPRHLDRNTRGVDGALLDLEYQRIELIKFNLFDNYTFETYVRGNEGLPGRAVKSWPEMRLSADHPRYVDVGGSDERQMCTGDLIRFRTVSGICNDILNPAMGATGQLFARNVTFEEAFPILSDDPIVRNRHGGRISLMEPDPQVVSRVLFTRQDRPTDNDCNDGLGTPDHALATACGYSPAPFFNVLAAFWIQFMTHDWFSHMSEGQNNGQMMDVGCNGDAEARYGCRADDVIDGAIYSDTAPPRTFEHDGGRYQARARKTTPNTNTAWWDASQIYGFDDVSRSRVKRDPADRAKLLMVQRGSHAGDGEQYGYLPTFDSMDRINPAWRGQEAAAFADNWTIGMSFYHNLFVREHNIFVDTFRERARQNPDEDSGLRDPSDPERVIGYSDVSDDELFEAARLVVSAEIAKIHTIEWTTQLLYDEPLFLAMNANWSGLLPDDNLASKALETVVVKGLGQSGDADAATQWFSVFASGAGIFGLGNRDRGSRLQRLLSYVGGPDDYWDITDPEDVNGGVNHFGSPFNFPEEFVTVYRLHPLVPDLAEFREWDDPNGITQKVSYGETFRGDATDAMTEGGLASWAVTMGRQRLGLLQLQNHPRFLQNLQMPVRLADTPTNRIDVVALDVLRDRERGIPRFNEFRRQYGLKQLTSFDDFVNVKASPEAQTEQRRLVGLLREVYGQHTCDASKVITRAQVNPDGSPIDDCLGHPDGSVVDNIEDLDTVVGWLAESTRPHGFAISETQFQVFILNASRRLFSDRFFTSSFRPEFYTTLGVEWVNNNGPDGKVMERGTPNGHEMEVSPLKRVLLRAMPELSGELDGVVNAFDPWARDRGEYYSLEWTPRPGAESDPAFGNR
jgi:hypothetical protein